VRKRSGITTLQRTLLFGCLTAGKLVTFWRTRLALCPRACRPRCPPATVDPEAMDDASPARRSRFSTVDRDGGVEVNHLTDDLGQTSHLPPQPGITSFSLQMLANYRRSRKHPSTAVEQCCSRFSRASLAACPAHSCIRWRLPAVAHLPALRALIRAELIRSWWRQTLGRRCANVCCCHAASRASGECACNHGFVGFRLRQSVRVGRMYHRLRRSQEPGSYLYRAGARISAAATPRA
jgi:hypothetical protein